MYIYIYIYTYNLVREALEAAEHRDLMVRTLGRATSVASPKGPARLDQARLD